jgi:uncharacterized protein
MKRLYWSEVEDAIEKLAEKIEQSQFKPDYIVGITSGGLFPLAFLVKRLKVKNIFTITARKVKEGDQEHLKIAYLPRIDLTGKKVLLVDEIAQSGTTLHALANTIRGLGAETLKTATFAVNTDACEMWPDYYVLIEQGDWIMFPWETKDEFPPYTLDK